MKSSILINKNLKWYRFFWEVTTKTFKGVQDIKLMITLLGKCQIRLLYKVWVSCTINSSLAALWSEENYSNLL